MNRDHKSKSVESLISDWEMRTLQWQDGVLVLTPDWDYPHQVIAIDEMMHALGKTRSVLFDVGFRGTAKLKRLVISPLGNRFLDCLGYDIRGIEDGFSKHKLSPYVSLLSKHLSGRGYPARSSLSVHNVAEFNRWVEEIREEIRQAGFGKAIDNQLRSMRKNAASLLGYLSALRELYARLLVVRLDLGYLRVFRKDGPEIDPVTVKDHWEKLYWYLNKNFPSLVGFVWKLEYGVFKSYHYHVILFFDGNEVREDVTLGERIGEEWKRNITGGSGSYWNCNARKEQFERMGRLGIGDIRHDDADSWANLERAALYLVKVDWYVRLNAPGVGRTFGRGALPAPRKDRRGRPRRGVCSP